MTVPIQTLADGATIPQVGFGLYRLDPDDTERVVEDALAAGYRHLDSAAIYRNEAAVGRALRAADLPRDELFITSKVWNSEQHSAAQTRDACLRTLDDLGLEVLDLYLIHWPAPRFDRYVQTWSVLQELRDEGLVRSVGVSNFEQEHLQRLDAAHLPTPVVNQVEMHPYFQRRDLSAYCRERGIQIEAWGPLAQGRSDLLTNPAVAQIASDVERTSAQVVLRWHLQQGNIIFPKSASASRMAENLAILDFELGSDQVAAIDGLDRDQRMGASSYEQH